MSKYDTYFKLAEELYCKDLKSIPEISKIISVSQTTMYKWKQMGGWDQKREETLSNPKTQFDLASKQLTRMLEEIAALPMAEVSSKDIDKLSKIAKVVEQLKRGYSKYEVAVSFLGDFHSWAIDRLGASQASEIFDVLEKYATSVRNE